MSDFRNQVQKEAVEIALGSKQGGTLDITMRLGKTKIGAQIASNFKKVLVSYPNKPILKSWLDDSVKFNIDISHIEFTTHISLKKKNLDDYDCIILDEVHEISLANWEYISCFKTRLYGLSGTPSNKGEKLRYLNEYCPIIYSKKLDETTGKTNKDYEIFVHVLQPNTEKNLSLKSGKSWSEAQKINFFDYKYNLSRDFKMMLMLIQTIQNSETKIKYLQKLVNTLDKCLIFVETTKQCEYLKYPSFNSKDKNSENNLTKFLNGDITKLTTINQLKAGVTFENLNKVVILHCYSSNNKAAQKIARALNYVEGEKAEIHIITLDNTRDMQWTESGLKDFDNNKIKWLKK